MCVCKCFHVRGGFGGCLGKDKSLHIDSTLLSVTLMVIKDK